MQFRPGPECKHKSLSRNVFDQVMPTTKSGKKRHRQSLERRAKNRATKSSIKTQVKKIRAAVQAADLAKADSEFRVVAKKLDRAAAKRVIHPNSAARTKSRLQQLMKTAKAGKAAPTS